MQLLIGAKVKDKSEYYVKRADRDTVYDLGEWQVNSLFKNQKELLEQEGGGEPAPGPGNLPVPQP